MHDNNKLLSLSGIQANDGLSFNKPTEKKNSQFQSGVCTFMDAFLGGYNSNHIVTVDFGLLLTSC